LTVIARDRQGLFATIAGALSGWGMNIVRAAAFSNASGVIVDTFLFTDSFRTLELNPQERQRFPRSIAQAVLGEVLLDELMRGRLYNRSRRDTAPIDPPLLRFDDESSGSSTVMELIAGDRPGLLYRVASVMAHHGCNIEIALIDTEGRSAIDVFYVSKDGGKVPLPGQQALSDALIEELTSE
jgi:[protein-PII] uridylyltransferase